MNGKSFWLIFQTCLVFFVAVVHLLITPYTKVEESFGVQAVHDYIYLSKGFGYLFSSDDSKIAQNESYSAWDHENFPGVVHRTFFPNFILFVLVKPFEMLQIFNEKVQYQYLSRVCLLLCFLFAYYKFIQSVYETIGLASTILTTMLMITQFHVLFYGSRMLPNTNALIFMMLSYWAWIKKQWKLFIFLFAFTVLVIRLETILLFGCICLYEVFYTKQLSLIDIFWYGIPSGLASLIFTILFDSYMWNKWIWPEGDTIIFNIVENKSHLWGTQPFFWYFNRVIPNIFFTSTIFLLFTLHPRFWCRFTLVSFLFIFLYSFLPHKELRFIIYVVPLLNVSISHVILTILSLINDIQKSTMKLIMSKNRNEDSVLRKICSIRIVRYLINRLDRLFMYGLLLNFSLNLIFTGIKLYVSHYNYPGGIAMSIVNEDIRLERKNSPPHSHHYMIGVYVCDLAAQSGFTRFMELNNVYYNKDSEFDPMKFQTHDLIYMVIEPKDYRGYFLDPTDNGDCPSECLMKTSENRPIKCHILQSVLKLNTSTIYSFEMSLFVYKCSKF